jgi:hypothetical protein
MLQSSGKVKQKQDSKITIKKVCQEIHLQWDQLLTIALLRIRSSSTKPNGWVSPL